MERANAYAALASELERWRQKDPADLLARVGVAPISHDIELAGEVVSIEVSVAWVDASRQELTVEAVANGPSHWATERLTERITLPSPLARPGGGL
jgi:hypothetical protein